MTEQTIWSHRLGNERLQCNAWVPRRLAKNSIDLSLPEINEVKSLHINLSIREDSKECKECKDLSISKKIEKVFK